MKLDFIDNGKEFDFGKTSSDYYKYRDIYSESLYEKLISYGIGKSGQKILDLGSGTAVLPINMAYTGALFTATDISENQVNYGKAIAEKKHIGNIRFKVCSAEKTGFPDNCFDVVTAVQCFQYFNAIKAAEEIQRVLKADGLFCKVFMDWLPFEDEIISEMEQIVLKYNPGWGGCGFKSFEYSYPDWAKNRFQIEAIHSYNVCLTFLKEEWIGRIKTCRGIGASLSEAEVKEFEAEYRGVLRKYREPLLLKHQIHIELYRCMKND